MEKSGHSQQPSNPHEPSDSQKPSDSRDQFQPRDHGPWRILQSREAYRDPWVNLRRDEVIRPDGQPGSYCVVGVKPGVCVVAVDDRGTMHLTEEFHYGVGRVTIEAVSGGVEVGEAAAEAAERELREELGITARRWIDLGTVDPFTANVVSPTRLFLARDLQFGPPETDGGEIIRPYPIPMRAAVDAVLESRITHAPSAVAILKAHLMLGSDPSL
jgi:ADP-ribose pyrophosphatase